MCVSSNAARRRLTQPSRAALLLALMLGLCACEKQKESLGAPVGIRLSVGDVAVEAALAVSKSREPDALVPEMAGALQGALGQCPDAMDVLKSGGALRLGMHAEKGVLQLADAATGVGACLGKSVGERRLSAKDSFELLVELRAEEK
jgi:hypothetical protein